MNKIKRITYRLLDFPIAVLAALAAIPARICWQTRRAIMPLTVAVSRRMGVHCMRNHYYEPKTDYSKDPLNQSARTLPAIDFNHMTQVGALEAVDSCQNSYSPVKSPNQCMFGNIDSRILHGMVTHFEPSRMIEIGSGHSTKIARQAASNSITNFEHFCIEPYECDWLERLGVTVIREKVENVPVSFFSTLGDGDILFIDSSHVIRPDGDVEFELNRILPSLNRGVIVHVHDIFTPFNYPRKWVEDDLRLWNEQYMLEAFLANNSEWEILLAANYLKNAAGSMEHLPWAKGEENPGSIWLRKL